MKRSLCLSLVASRELCLTSLPRASEGRSIFDGGLFGLIRPDASPRQGSFRLGHSACSASKISPSQDALCVYNALVVVIPLKPVSVSR